MSTHNMPSSKFFPFRANPFSEVTLSVGMQSKSQKSCPPWKIGKKKQKKKLPGGSCSKLTMLLVNVLLKLRSLNMAYMLIFFAEKIPVN